MIVMQLLQSFTFTIAAHLQLGNKVLNIPYCKAALPHCTAAFDRNGSPPNKRTDPVRHKKPKSRLCVRPFTTWSVMPALPGSLWHQAGLATSKATVYGDNEYPLLAQCQGLAGSPREQSQQPEMVGRITGKKDKYGLKKQNHLSSAFSEPFHHFSRVASHERNLRLFGRQNQTQPCRLDQDARTVSEPEPGAGVRPVGSGASWKEELVGRNARQTSIQGAHP